MNKESWIQISTFPYKRVVPAWIGLVIISTIILLKVSDQLKTDSGIIGVYLIPLLFLLSFFIYLTIVPKKYDVFYNEKYLRLYKAGQETLISLEQVGLLDINLSTMNPFGNYNNCCLAFRDFDGEASAIYFYSNNFDAMKKTNELENFIHIVRNHNPEFKYEKHMAFIKISK